MPRIVKKKNNGKAGSVFDKLDVRDDGVTLSTEEIPIGAIDFIGDSFKVITDGTGVAYVLGSNVDFASSFNDNSGTTDGRLEYTINPVVRFISSPDSEGDPFFTGGFGGSLDFATNLGEMTISTREQITDMTDSTFFVQILDPDGNVISQYRTPVINSNISMSSNDSHLRVVVSSFEKDVFKTKAIVSITIDYGSILADSGINNGKFDVRIVHELSGGLDNKEFLLSESGYLNDFFYDGTTIVPSYSGVASVSEVFGGVLTKHLSGLEYYVLGSAFDVSVTGLDNHNHITALPNSSVLVNANDFGVQSYYASPISGSIGNEDFTGWSSSYSISDVDYRKAILVDKQNFRFIGSAVLSSTVYDSWNFSSSTIYSAGQNVLIDTFTIQSDDVSEYFNSEDYRSNEDYVVENWDSVRELRSDIGYPFAKIHIVDNNGLKGGEAITVSFNSGPVTITAGVDFEIGASSGATIFNIMQYINGINEGIVATQRNDDESVLDLVKTSSGPSGNGVNSSTASKFVLNISNFEGGTNDAMFYRGSLISPSASKLTSGEPNSNWTDFFPRLSGNNPDYTGKTVPCSFYRSFNDTSGLSRTSMRIDFAGTFPSGLIKHLEDGDLKIYVRKKNSLTIGGLFGVDAPVMKLHGYPFGFFGTFDQGISDEGSYIREDGSSGNTVNATFGTFKCSDGIYMEVMICRDDIYIDSMVVTFS